MSLSLLLYVLLCVIIIIIIFLYFNCSYVDIIFLACVELQFVCQLPIKRLCYVTIIYDIMHGVSLFRYDNQQKMLYKILSTSFKVNK